MTLNLSEAASSVSAPSSRAFSMKLRLFKANIKMPAFSRHCLSPRNKLVCGEAASASGGTGEGPQIFNRLPSARLTFPSRSISPEPS